MTARFTLLRALLDRAHPARREYARFRATPEEAAEAVQAARAKLDATVQAEAKPGENPAAECGPECAEQHMYAYRCALKPPPISPWKILGAWQAAPAPTSPDRRQRYADAVHKALRDYGEGDWDPGTGSDYGDQAAAVLAVRDAELEDMYQRLATQAVAAHDVITKLGEAEAELVGARATIEHMSKAMSWIAGHDRQGLDHMEEAQQEARDREAAEAALERVRKIPRIPHASQQDGELGRAYTRGWQSVITALDGALAGRPVDPEADTYPPTGAAPERPAVAVAYRSRGGRLLRCPAHHPGQDLVDCGDFHSVTAEDLPDGGLCSYPLSLTERCDVDVLVPQQPAETCDHDCSCSHQQGDHNSSGRCKQCDCTGSTGHYGSECPEADRA